MSVTIKWLLNWSLILLQILNSRLMSNMFFCSEIFISLSLGTIISGGRMSATISFFDIDGLSLVFYLFCCKLITLRLSYMLRIYYLLISY